MTNAPPVPTPAVSLVIVTWNGRDLLERCLRALETQTFRPAEVIVVDNASTDGTAAWLRSARPDVRLVESPVNTGFAEGNNIGVRAARGEFVCLLNNDAEPGPEWLQRLVERAVRSDSALLASKVLTDGVPDAFTEMNGTLNYLGYNIMRVFRDPAAIFYASAAALLFRRAEVGEPFPAEYFLYCEDVHLSLRMRLLGRGVEMVPGSVVRHRGSASTKKQRPALVSYYQVRNRLLTTLVFFSPWTILRLLPYLLFDFLARLLLSVAGKGAPAGAVVKAYAWVATHPGWILAERNRVRPSGAVQDDELLRHMSAHVLEGKGMVARTVNACSRGYAQLVRLPFVRHA